MLSPAPRPDPGVKEEVRWSLDGFRARSTRLSTIAAFVLGVTNSGRLVDAETALANCVEPKLGVDKVVDRRNPAGGRGHATGKCPFNCRGREGDSMATHVYFSGGLSITVEEDFDQVQQRLEHEAGLFTLMTAAEPGHRVSIHRSAVAYIEEILMGEQAESPRRHTAAARRRAASTEPQD
jgi:hypothetical protein